MIPRLGCGGHRDRFGLPILSLQPLRVPCSPVNQPCFGHDSGRNDRFRGHPGVAGQLRRVVVARRCARHHLQRVMVETPPRAGPSPPHGPARFFCPPGRTSLLLTGRLPSPSRVSCLAPPISRRDARNEEFTGAPSCVVAWRRLFEGISQAGRRPNHGCRISADGAEPSAREALCTSPTVRSRHGRHGGGPIRGPRQCMAVLRTCLTVSVCLAASGRTTGIVRQALHRPARSRPPGPASTPSLPDLFRGGTSFRGDQHKAPQA